MGRQWKMTNAGLEISCLKKLRKFHIWEVGEWIKHKHGRPTDIYWRGMNVWMLSHHRFDKKTCSRQSPVWCSMEKIVSPKCTSLQFNIQQKISADKHWKDELALHFWQRLENWSSVSTVLTVNRSLRPCLNEAIEQSPENWRHQYVSYPITYHC